MMDGDAAGRQRRDGNWVHSKYPRRMLERVGAGVDGCKEDPDL